MGEYYCWVNVDRKEYISPFDFAYGNKRFESCQRDGEVLRTLRDLLSKEWKGSRIFWLGDECGLPENISNELFASVKNQCDEFCCSGYIFDTVFESYINVSSLYKASEENVRKEIENYLFEIAHGNNNEINEYGVNPLNPFNGLFQRDGINSKYIINFTKKICYSFDETKMLFQDGTECDYVDPLPFFMGYGEGLVPGEWLGDIIGVSDVIQDNITIIESITLPW